MPHIRHDGQTRTNFINKLCQKKQTSISVSSSDYQKSLNKRKNLKENLKENKFEK